MINRKAIGYITANYTSKERSALLDDRPLASCPFLGRYRLIDFPLSNMMNAGIRTVGVVLPGNYRSLVDHLGSGQRVGARPQEGRLVPAPGKRVRHRQEGHAIPAPRHQCEQGAVPARKRALCRHERDEHRVQHEPKRCHRGPRALRLRNHHDLHEGRPQARRRDQAQHRRSRTRHHLRERMRLRR